MDAVIWTIIIVAIVVAVIALAASWYFAQQRRRSQQLRDEFGPEYDRALDEHGSKRDAERALMQRQERVARLRLRPLTPEQRKRFGDSWTATQAHFVDEPSAAINDAQNLVDEAMTARGFPLADFDTRAADISVEHPQVVENYRAARDIAEANDRGDADTEQLRQGMVHYRALFNELINTVEQPRAEIPTIERTEISADDREGERDERRSRTGRRPDRRPRAPHTR